MVGTLASLLALSAHASPCTGVDRTLSDARRAALAPAIAHQLTLPFVDVLQSFRLKGWSIVYVDTHVSDERFLFYSADPLTGHAVTEWGGAATRDEGDDIQRWLLKNAPSIPPALARCFAWHVTQDRDQ